MHNKENNLNNQTNINIKDVVSCYLQLTKKGKNYWGVCPFHNDTSPSLSVSVEKNLYKCFTCNKAGNAISFVMDFKGISKSEAIKEIENTLGIKINSFISNIPEHKLRMFDLNELASNIYSGFLFRNENKDKLDYLINRKISLDQIKKFRIGYAVDEFDKFYSVAINKDNIRGFQLDKKHIFTEADLLDVNLVNISNNGKVYDFFHNRIMIPIFDENNYVVGFSGRSFNSNQPKYLNSPTNEIFKKEEILYNMNNYSAKNDTAFLVEGFFDLFALDLIKIPNCLATMGVAFSYNHLNWIIKKGAKKIVLAFDNDNAGVSAIIKSANLIKDKLDIYVIRYDSKYKDFNEILTNESEQKLIEIVNQKQHFSIFYLEHLLTNLNQSDDLSLQNSLEQCLQIIKVFGNNIYFDQYKSILKKYLNITDSVVELKLNSIKYNNKTNSYKQTNNYNNNYQYNGFKKDSINQDSLNSQLNNLRNYSFQFRKLIDKIDINISKLIYYSICSIELFNQIVNEIDFYNYPNFASSNLKVVSGMIFPKIIKAINKFYNLTETNSILSCIEQFNKFLDDNGLIYEKYIITNVILLSNKKQYSSSKENAKVVINDTLNLSKKYEKIVNMLNQKK